MNHIKPRKQRGLKKDGTRSFDFCRGCYLPFVIPWLCRPESTQRYQIVFVLVAALRVENFYLFVPVSLAM